MGKKLTIDLGDLPMTQEEHHALVGAVHSAVVSHLAKSGNAGVHTATKSLHEMGMGLAAATPAAKKPVAKKK